MSHPHQCIKCDHLYNCDLEDCSEELRRLDRRCRPDGYTDVKTIMNEPAWRMKRSNQFGARLPYYKETKTDGASVPYNSLSNGDPEKAS